MRDLEMTRTWTSLLALSALTAACATATPTEEVQVASLDCTALHSELARNAEAQRAAAQKQQDAWKAVVPFAVMARYGQGKAAAAESEQRLAELQAQAARQGCAGPRQ
jgi:hypothetical protein